MKLWNGDNTAVPVRWFRAETNAKVISFPHRFLSSNWDQFRDNPSIGEQGTVRHAWNNGANTLGYNGSNRCGGNAPWQDGGYHGITPAILTKWNGTALCCSGQVDPGPPPVQSCLNCVSCGPETYRLTLSGLVSPYDMFNGTWDMAHDESTSCTWSVTVGSGPTAIKAEMVIGNSPFMTNASLLWINQEGLPATNLVWFQPFTSPIDCCAALAFSGQTSSPTGTVPADVVVTPVAGPCSCG